MIEVEHLTKRYGPRAAVEDVSFRVSKGEIVGFLGPNGAGKSTTLRMLTGFLAPSGGTIRIDGIDALAHPVEAKRRIGYMPEACPLYPEMRAREYLRYRAELKGVPRAKLASSVERALEQASVAEAGDRILGQLSKGTRQRVGLADALVSDPPILVLDEPTAGLDPNQIRQVRELVRGLAGQKTVLVSTHILPEVEATCERVVIIHRGRVVREGAPGALRASVAGGASLVLEARATWSVLEAALTGLPGVRAIEQASSEGAALVRARVLAGDDGDVAEAVFRACAAAGVVLRELRPERAASLEEVFERLTTDESASSTPSSEAARGDEPSVEDPSTAEGGEEAP